MAADAYAQGLGNLLEDTRTIGAEVMQASYSYDGAHQLASVTYPAGRTVSYGRDAVGRITSVTTDFGGQNQTVASSAQYLPFWPLAGFTFGNGIVVERSYDQQYRLGGLTSTGVEDLTYVHDPAGNIDAISDHLNASFSRAFVQDPLDRLTSDQGAFGTRTYQYDPVGNRTGRWLDGAPEQTITVVSNSNRLATINVAAVSYDAAGNVLADGTGRTFAYNDLNRLVTASVSGQPVATFAYNAFGQRARKTETASNTSTVFSYAPHGTLRAERRLRSDGTRELEREYLWLDSLPIVMAERSYAADGTTVTASQFVYLHADHLDTPRLATDAAQRVVWRWRSDAFGIGTADTDPDGDSIATEVALRFPGQYLDAETELQYNYFRDYDPTLGRYIESDPLGLIAGANTFGYGFQNPLLNFDPDGLEVRFICREVLGVPTKAQHCFVFVSCPAEGWSRVLSLFRAESGSQKRRGYKYGYTPGDSAAAARQADFRRDRPAHPGNTFDGEVEPPQCYVESCGYEREVLGRFHRFPSHYVPYAWPGPIETCINDLQLVS